MAAAAAAVIGAAASAVIGAAASAPASTLTASAVRSLLGGGRASELQPASAWAPRPSEAARPASISGSISISVSVSRSTNGVYFTPPAAVTSRTISRANEGCVSMCQDGTGALRGAPRGMLLIGRFPAKC